MPRREQCDQKRGIEVRFTMQFLPQSSGGIVMIWRECGHRNVTKNKKVKRKTHTTPFCVVTQQWCLFGSAVSVFPAFGKSVANRIPLFDRSSRCLARRVKLCLLFPRVPVMRARPQSSFPRAVGCNSYSTISFSFVWSRSFADGTSVRSGFLLRRSH